MRSCKRIEIVIEQPLAKRIGELLVELQAPGYTVMGHAGGCGDRGLRRADEPTGTASNCVFVIACADQACVERIVNGIRPILARSGGICLVSDALWVRH